MRSCRGRRIDRRWPGSPAAKGSDQQTGLAEKRRTGAEVRAVVLALDGGLTAVVAGGASWAPRSGAPTSGRSGFCLRPNTILPFRVRSRPRRRSIRRGGRAEQRLPGKAGAGSAEAVDPGAADE